MNPVAPEGLRVRGGRLCLRNRMLIGRGFFVKAFLPGGPSAVLKSGRQFHIREIIHDPVADETLKRFQRGLH
jgi:hypothetical protein